MKISVITIFCIVFVFLGHFHHISEQILLPVYLILMV